MRAVYERGAGDHVAERVSPVPGSPEEAKLAALAEDPASPWRRVPDPEPEPETPADDDPPARPAKSASKADWVAYAVAQGAAQDEAAGMTVAQLIEKHGGTDGQD